MGAGVRDAFPPPMCCVDCLRVSFGWIVCKWLFYLCGIAWQNMMEIGRGGACVPARVALRGRIHRSSSHGLASCYAKKAVHECGAQLFL